MVPGLDVEKRKKKEAQILDRHNSNTYGLTDQPINI